MKTQKTQKSWGQDEAKFIAEYILVYKEFGFSDW